MITSKECKDQSKIDNAKKVLALEIPDRFEWGGRGPEPDWFQGWIKKKALLVKRVAEIWMAPSLDMVLEGREDSRGFPEADIERHDRK